MHHRPAFFGGEAAQSKQQDRVGRQPQPVEQGPAQIFAAEARREAAGFGPHPDRHRLAQSPRAQPVGQRLVRAHDEIEHPVQPAQMPPEAAEPAIDGGDAGDAPEPAIGVGGERIGMHHQRPRRGALPAADHRRARPWRRGLDMIGLPAIQRPMQRRLVVEIAIAPVDRQRRRRDRRQHRSGPAVDDLVALAGREQDHLVTETRRLLELAFEVGSHAAAGGRVEGTDIDNTHQTGPDTGSRAQIAC